MMWLLIAALPVQSWAVATMINCGPTHHRMAGQTAVEADQGHAHTAHTQDTHTLSGHDQAPHHHDTVVDANADHDQSDTDPQPLSMGKFKCSACATCCLGMALPSRALTFDASVSADTVQPGIPRGHAVFLTAGLERPPRTLLT
ncbi:hypothetical protein ACVNIS_08275 [Sphaerotilaceae bacterium SBD11-9]